VFGRVVAGMDVVLAIPERDPRTASGPGTAMKRVEITEEDAAA
jgi:cyclophilin family peptidyl-prolyl cis-trans isomerase